MRAALGCYSVELCFHLGLQRFSVCEVKSSRCAQSAWTSLVSWPVTATISQHLPIKASHFLPSPPCDSLTGRAMTAPRLLIGHFPFPKSRNGWLHHLARHSMTSPLPLVVSSERDHISAALIFMFFSFLLLFFSHRSEDFKLLSGLILRQRARKRSKVRTTLSARLCLSANVLWYEQKKALCLEGSEFKTSH